VACLCNISATAWPLPEWRVDNIHLLRITSRAVSGANYAESTIQKHRRLVSPFRGHGIRAYSNASSDYAKVEYATACREKIDECCPDRSGRSAGHFLHLDSTPSRPVVRSDAPVLPKFKPASVLPIRELTKSTQTCLTLCLGASVRSTLEPVAPSPDIFELRRAGHVRLLLLARRSC
jgi:hypothetical protein